MLVSLQAKDDPDTEKEPGMSQEKRTKLSAREAKVYQWLQKESDSGGTVRLTGTVVRRAMEDLKVNASPNIYKDVRGLERKGYINREELGARGEGFLIKFVDWRPSAAYMIENLIEDAERLIDRLSDISGLVQYELNERARK